MVGHEAHAADVQDLARHILLLGGARMRSLPEVESVIYIRGGRARVAEAKESSPYLGRLVALDKLVIAHVGEGTGIRVRMPVRP